MAAETAILRFLCNICCTIVKQENVNQHLKVFHGNISSKCERCGFAETNQNKMLSHLHIHLQERFECPRCGDIYSTGKAYLKHYLGHSKSLFHRKVFYECSECGESFYPSSDIQERLKQHEAQHVQTEECQTQAWDPSALLSTNVKEEKNDVEEQLDEKPYVRELTQGLEDENADSTDSYFSNGNFDEIGSSQPNTMSVFLGDIKSFDNEEPGKDNDNKNDHLETVKEDCLPELNSAGTGVVTQAKLIQTNLKSHRPRRQSTKNVCYEVLLDECDNEPEDDESDSEYRLGPTKTKVSETTVRSHRPKRQCTDSKVNGVLSCKVCKKTFKSKAGFQYHNNTQHLEERKALPCKICAKTFMTKQGLQVHWRNQHNGQINLVTIKEENETKMDNDLEEGKLNTEGQQQKREYLQNDKVEMWSCEVCEKTFKSKNGFEYHKNTQHGVQRELLPCEFCERTFRTKQGLQNHQKNHHPDKVDFYAQEDSETELDTEPEVEKEEGNGEEQTANTKSLSCKVCKKVFKNKRLLRYHQKSEHKQRNVNRNKDTKLVSCSICEKVFKNNHRLYYHKRTAHNKKVRKYAKTDTKMVSCEICEKPFKSWFLEYHKKTHHSDKNYDTTNDIDTKVIACDICKEIFETTLSLKLHLKEVHQKEIPEESITSDEEEYVPRKRTFRGIGGECPICKKYYKNGNSLRMHVKNKHEERDTLICRFCKKQFASKNCVEVHERTQHFEENIALGVVPCEICQKLFTSMDRLRDHQKNYHLEKGMELCSVCGETFKSKSQYRYHMKQHKANFECKACHKTFHTMKKLKGHMNVAGCHMCEVCGMKFKQHYNLVTHRTVHTGEKPFQCYECGKCFRVKYYLEEHLRVHKGIRNHPCTLCDWKFKTTGQLKRHMRSHTGFRPHMCSQCGKAFAFPANLKRHERIHTGETYSCPLCDRKITEKSNLQKHLRTHEKRGEKILGPVTVNESTPLQSSAGDKETVTNAQPVTNIWQLQMAVSAPNVALGSQVIDMDEDTGKFQMDTNRTEGHTFLDADQDTSALLGLI